MRLAVFNTDTKMYDVDSQSLPRHWLRIPSIDLLNPWSHTMATVHYSSRPAIRYMADTTSIHPIHDARRRLKGYRDPEPRSLLRLNTWEEQGAWRDEKHPPWRVAWPIQRFPSLHLGLGRVLCSCTVHISVSLFLSASVLCNDTTFEPCYTSTRASADHRHLLSRVQHEDNHCPKHESPPSPRLRHRCHARHNPLRQGRTTDGLTIQ
jgi:hypothetical protein